MDLTQTTKNLNLTLVLDQSLKVSTLRPREAGRHLDLLDKVRFSRVLKKKMRQNVNQDKYT
jgi:hypothetical protein